MHTVENWFNEFQRMSCFGGATHRCPEITTMEDIVTKIHDHVLTDCQLKEREIVGIWKTSVGLVLSNIMGIRESSAEWVSLLFILDYKRDRENPSQKCLMLLKSNQKQFLYSFVIVDEYPITGTHEWPSNSRNSEKQENSLDQKLENFGQDGNTAVNAAHFLHHIEYISQTHMLQYFDRWFDS